MTGYQIPQDETTLDFQYWLDYAIDHERHTPPTMQPCRNVDCRNRSYAIFCSESCRVTCEGDDTADYYADPDSDTLLGLKTLADDQRRRDGENLAALACGYGPQPAMATFSEAPVSCTVKGLHHGQDTMITIRGTDFASVQAQLDAACTWFDVPAAPVAQSTHGETGEGWCRLHSTQMRWNPGKGGESGWWSHKAADGSGWCKGRVKGQVRQG